jgi:plasmid stabilization system protein ParE
MTSAYALHPETENDIDEIWEFIAAQSPDNADAVREALYDMFAMLASEPGMGHYRFDLTKKRQMRFMSVHNYLIAYSSDEKPLWILAVLYGGRSPKLLSRILQGRDAP